MATHFITSKQDKIRLAEIMAVFPYRPAPFPADSDRFGNGTKVVCGVVIEDSRPQPTIEQQSTCRGEFPRVYRPRDYSHCRGLCKWDRPLTSLEILVAAKKALREKLAAIKREDVHKLPLDERREWTAMRIETWSFRKRTAHSVPKSNILTATELYPLTPHQQMRGAIQDAIAAAPLVWSEYEPIDLPFGFKLVHKGYADVVARVQVKERRNGKYRPTTKTIVVGQLASEGYVPLEGDHFEKALSKIMEIINGHKLDRPTPPTSPASQPVRKRAA